MKHVTGVRKRPKHVSQLIGGGRHPDWQTYIVGNSRASVELSAAYCSFSQLRTQPINRAIRCVHALSCFPSSKQFDKEVVTKSGIQHLRDKKDIGTER